jgi:hypothetical protein
MPCLPPLPFHLSIPAVGTDPIALITQHPDVLLNLGEANVADSAEYGELSTKD